MNKPTLARRTGALLAVTALGAVGLVAAPGAATAAPVAGADQAPATASASWLAGQLEDGLLTYENFGTTAPDPGLSLDALFALDSVGGHEDAVADVAAAVAADLEGYSDYSYDYEGVQYEGRAANAVAKSLAGLVVAGVDPREVGGTDLVERLEGLTDDTGRIADLATVDGEPDPAGDYANVLGQSFAARGLDAAGSPEAGAATAFLLDQQCEEGFFRFDFGPDDLSCDAASDAAGDIDATALAVVNLATQRDKKAVADAIADAAAWLGSKQAQDGSFGSADFEANANGTGLAGWALGLAGRATDAAEAAAWLRARQLTNVGTCTPFRPTDLGAVAYDDAALAGARKDGITAATEGQYLRATAQALPALQWAPAAGGANVLAAPDYVKAGSRVSPGVIGAAPGEWLCASVAGATASVPADVAGEAVLRVRLPKAAGTRTVTVSDADGVVGTARFRALGATKLTVRAKKNAVRRGANQVVKVRGLAPAEPVRVVVGGRRVDTGQANAKGRFTGRFKATGSGRTKVVVKGQFGNRRGTAAYRVTR